MLNYFVLVSRWNLSKNQERKYLTYNLSSINVKNTSRYSYFTHVMQLNPMVIIDLVFFLQLNKLNSETLDFNIELVLMLCGSEGILTVKINF